jgi:hypothetical protein
MSAIYIVSENNKIVLATYDFIRIMEITNLNFYDFPNSREYAEAVEETLDLLNQNNNKIDKVIPDVLGAKSIMNKSDFLEEVKSWRKTELNNLEIQIKKDQEVIIKCEKELLALDE